MIFSFGTANPPDRGLSPTAGVSEMVRSFYGAAFSRLSGSALTGPVQVQATGCSSRGRPSACRFARASHLSVREAASHNRRRPDAAAIGTRLALLPYKPSRAFLDLTGGLSCW